MEVKDLKKFLAGLCVAGLISGSTFALSSCSPSQSA
jgi:radical SAM modification target selenobiotic family peptide